MGEVYKAQDLKLGRTVALKFLAPELLEDRQARQRLMEEARAAAALNSPQIATIYEFGDDSDQPYIAMEFVEGDTLAQRIEKGPLEIATALNIATQVVQGLKAAHACGLIHRDLKSSNIIITPDGHVKILDFGMAELIGRLSTGGSENKAPEKSSRSAAISGTFSYMSPEQARGEAIDARSDIFSFGVVLYEMVAGCQPFDGECPADILHQVLTSEPSPLRVFRDDVPLALESIVRKSLGKDRNDRYVDVDAVLAELNRLQNALKSPARCQEIDSTESTLEQWRRESTSHVPKQWGAWISLILQYRRIFLAFAILDLVAAILDSLLFPAQGFIRLRDTVLLCVSVLGFLGYAVSFRKLPPSPARLPKGAAFRGLLSFQEADRDRFYGRELDTIALSEKIANEEFRFGVLYGDSGCGKTSLLKAGLMPKLWESGYVPVYCRAHGDPQTALLQECRQKSGIECARGEAPQDYLHRAADELGATLVIICDQFEEFFVNLRSRREREPFIAFVAACHDDAHLPVKFLFSMRGDFLHLISSEFAGRIVEPLMSPRLYHLRNFDRGQAEEIIEKSVHRANLPFEPGLTRL
jgi:serine/threonine protein kinase